MVKKEEKFTLDFVNNGKEFAFPKWTILMHEAALENMITDSPNLTDEERDKLFRYYVLYESLKKLDDDVDFEEVKQLHPENLIVLFTAAYNAGKRDIYFRKG